MGLGFGEALKAAEELESRGLYTTVADARFAKPLDENLILELARNHEVLITIEENSIGGFGSFVVHFLLQSGMLDCGLKVRTMILPDRFLDQNNIGRMYIEAGLDAAAIVNQVFEVLGRIGVNKARA